MPIDHPLPHPIRRAARPGPRGVLIPALLLLAACDDPAGQAESAALTCAAPVQLAVGETAELTADAQGRVRCQVQGSGETEYVVAFVDTRAAEKARTGGEGYGDAFTPYTVAVDMTDVVPGVPSATRLAPSLAPDFALQQSTPPPLSAPTRETPWTLGERFSLYDGAIGAARTARVLRIYDGHFAVAWFEGDGEPDLPRFMAQLDSAWDVYRAHALPLMRGAYSDALPVTSPGAGQFLVVLRAQGRGEAAGWTAADRSSGAPRIWTEIKVRPGPSYFTLVELLAHETAHAFQALYMYRTRPAGVEESYAGATFWGVEGGADLVSFETIRRAAGVSLTANLDAQAAGASPAARRLVQWAQPGAGQLTEGYANAEGFLRRLAVQRVQAGEGEDAAVGEVLRGASDGWYGYDHMGARRTGLAERMRARLGAAWTPEDALLDWALAHAADDRTENARFQDPTFLRVWQVSGVMGSWQPMATLPAHGGAVSNSTRPYGSPDYVRMHVNGTQPFSAASSITNVRWRILRIR